MTKTRILAVVLIAVSSACTTLSHASKDTAAIQGVLEQWRSAMLAKDIDRLMTLYSDQFKAGDRDKAAEAKFLKTEIEEDGLVDNAMIVFEHSTITITGDHATVIPIAISGYAGSASVGLEFLREDGQWRVSSMTQ